MSFSWKISVLLLALALPIRLVAAEAWVGDPGVTLSADNPYLALAQRNVDHALTAKAPEVYWLVWGAVAVESRRRGDKDLSDRALAAVDVLAEKVRAKPSGHWDITMLLECAWLWKKAGGDSAGLGRWLDAARASVAKTVAECERGLAGDPAASWVTAAPNAMLQSAAVLALAADLYSNNSYGDLARAVVRAAAKHQLPGGAFSYLRDSGPSALYYGFDATFLGRYYQLTRDPEARRMLAAMAGYAHLAQSNGLIEGSSPTWWKHHWTTGGPIHGVEVIAGVSRDPVARALAAARLRQPQRYYFSHVAMYFWDPSIPVGELGADLCRLDENIRGPVLRRGEWQVVMPAAPYGDTVVGVTLAGQKNLSFDNYLEAAGVPILLREDGDYRGRDRSLFMIASEDAPRRGVCMGEGWIAAGSAFRPRRGIYDEPAMPPPEGWDVAQVWFADGKGLAGWLRAERVSGDAAAAGRPVGALHLGRPPEPSGKANHFRSGRFSLAFHGDQLRGVEVRGSEARASLSGDDAARVFEYGASLAPDGDAPSLARLDLVSGAKLVAARVGRPSGNALLVFNPSDAVANFPSPEAGRLHRSASPGETPVASGDIIKLGARELGVLFIPPTP